MDGHDRHDRRIEVWIRSFAPSTGAKRDRALKRARQLGARTDASVEIGVWGKSIERIEDDSTRRRDGPGVGTVRDRVEAFTDWADRAGVSIEPFFNSRRVESTILGESYRIVRLPTVAVAEYRDGDLAHVAPNRETRSDRTVAAIDRLDELLGEAAGTDADVRPAEPDLAYGPDRSAAGDGGSEPIEAPITDGSDRDDDAALAERSEN